MTSTFPNRQDVYCDTRSPFRYRLVWVGVDYQGAALEGQVRLNPNQESAVLPLADLTFSTVVLATLDGESVSQCDVTLDEGTIETIAAALGMGDTVEPGENIELWWDVQMTFNTQKSRITGGLFILTPGVTDA
jgi:hypothetical protein